MKEIFTWLDKNFEPILIALLFYGMTLLVTLQVVLRFGFDTGFSWSSELSRFIFVWLMYFSISYTTRTQSHIKISTFVSFFGEKVQKIILIVVDMFFILFSTILFVSSIKIYQSTKEFGDMAVTLDVSMNILYGAGVVGFLLIMIRLAQRIVYKLRNFSLPLEYLDNSSGLFKSKDDVFFAPKQDNHP
ncbi:TRAP transporter small permease [Salimicrobium flavidum]|uniref:TRAP-type C4-dicarboxylate transport system, small permease component n=1 Tax=Salimicrobium flavidum TaxID=570947 RepID=A0A1N7KR37_9BACI|nr:TRAP transporter small permease [Salimicrobium flavidum]SIS64024.1 TRAP-type C4-dicarboxylate transport system, small permease component [Salimicrobium flavidum]